MSRSKSPLETNGNCVTDTPIIDAAIRAVLATPSPDTDQVRDALNKMQEWACPKHGTFMTTASGDKICQTAGCDWHVPSPDTPSEGG